MPEFVINFGRLLTDATTWIMFLIPTAGGVMIGYHALMKAMEEGDAHSAASHNKAIKNILVGGAIGMSATAIVRVILAYFQ